MLLSWTSVKQSLERTACFALDVFTTGERKDWKRTLLLFSICCISSILLSFLLFLYLFFTLDYQRSVSGGIAGFFGSLLTVALFLSKRTRCLGTLFVVSVFMKKSRNLLLTAGTSIVVLKNVRNTLENLTLLVRSLVCNLKAKKASITAPFSSYIKMLKWMGGILKGVTDLKVVNLDSTLQVSPRIESEEFRLKLSEAEQKLNETVKSIQIITETVSSVSKQMFPAISFLILMMFIIVHVKKYSNNVKHKNRFITRKFVRFDEEKKRRGEPHVLPLTPKEEKLYAFIPSLRPNPKEGRAMLKFGAPVMCHFAAWVIFITVDALLYYFVEIITKKLAELKPFQVPLIVNFKAMTTLIGITLNEEKQDMDFSYSVTLFEEKCLPEPKLLLHTSVLPLSAILVTLLIMALMAAKVCQIRLIVCERFFSTASNARVEFLHSKILRKRLKKQREEKDCSIMSYVVKPQFWFPILFRSKEDSQIPV